MHRASRLKYGPASGLSRLVPGNAIQPRVDLDRLQIRMDMPRRPGHPDGNPYRYGQDGAGSDAAGTWGLSDAAFPPMIWEGTRDSEEDLSVPRWPVAITRIPHKDIKLSEKFPPPSLVGTDARHLLYKWAILSVASVEGPYKYWVHDKAMVLKFMLASIAATTSVFQRWGADERLSDEEAEKAFDWFQVVGLVKDDISNDPTAVVLDVTPTAVGLFARETMWDDRRGSLRTKIEQHYGPAWTNSSSTLQSWQRLPSSAIRL